MFVNTVELFSCGCQSAHKGTYILQYYDSEVINKLRSTGNKYLFGWKLCSFGKRASFRSVFLPTRKAHVPQVQWPSEDNPAKHIHFLNPNAFIFSLWFKCKPLCRWAEWDWVYNMFEIWCFISKTSQRWERSQRILTALLQREWLLNWKESVFLGGGWKVCFWLV